MPEHVVLTMVVEKMDDIYKVCGVNKLSDFPVIVDIGEYENGNLIGVVYHTENGRSSATIRYVRDRFEIECVNTMR